jgi:hypothetical protein
MTVAIDTSIKDANPITTGTSFQACSAIYVGGSGDITVLLAGSGKSVQFKSVPVGMFYVRAVQVSATSATGLLACYI